MVLSIEYNLSLSEIIFMKLSKDIVQVHQHIAKVVTLKTNVQRSKFGHLTLSSGMSFTCWTFSSIEISVMSAKLPFAITVSGNLPRYFPDTHKGDSTETSGMYSESNWAEKQKSIRRPSNISQIVCSYTNKILPHLPSCKDMAAQKFLRK